MSMFIKIEGVAGGSTADQFAEQIEVNSFSFSTSQPTSPIRSNNSHVDGRPSLSLFNFTKSCDASSALLLSKLWSGTTLAKATFTASRRDDSENLVPFLVIEMDNIVVANYSVSGGGGDPYENVALNYSKIMFNYKPQKDGGGSEGNLTSAYDLAKETSKYEKK